MFGSFAANPAAAVLADTHGADLPDRAANAAAACSLNNGDFEGGFAPWYLQVNPSNGASASLSADAGQTGASSAKVTVNSGSVLPWDIQLVHENAPMTPGKRYTLSFYARASGGAIGPIDAMLQQWVQPFTEVWKITPTLTGSWQRFDYTFDYPASAPTSTPAFRFNLARAAGSVWLDAVTLCESAAQPPVPTPQPVAAACRITNGDFENALAGWGLSQGNAQAALAPDTGARSATAARVSISAPGASPGDVRLSQGGLALTGGTWMALEFYARASVARGLNISIEGDGGALLWQHDVRLPDPAQDAAFKHVYLPLQIPASAANGTLRFNLGGTAGSVWIDAVHLCGGAQQFGDEFNGSALDTAKWQHCKPYSGDCAESVISNVQTWYKPGNVSVSNGAAHMAVTQERGTVCIGCRFGSGSNLTRDFASFYIQSNDAFATEYGHFEARMKMPKSKGIWLIFWLLPYVSPSGAWSWPPEIDVLEHYTYQPDRSWHTLHYNSATAFNASDGAPYRHPFNLGDDFHVYSANWTPDEIIFYVDSVETFRTSAYKVRGKMAPVLSAEVGALAGPSDGDLSQAVTDVDYVHVYANGEAFGFSGPAVQPPSATATPVPTTRPAPPTMTPGPSPTTNPRLNRKRYVPLLRVS